MLECTFGQAQASRSLTAPARCPHCDQWMVAPTVSEFVKGGVIRHHWVCETCAETSVSSIFIGAVSSVAAAE